jgi:hypothetical protein
MNLMALQQVCYRRLSPHVSSVILPSARRQSSVSPSSSSARPDPFGADLLREWSQSPGHLAYGFDGFARHLVGQSPLRPR